MIKVDDIVIYDVKECAEMLNKTPFTIRKYINQGKLPGQRISGRLYVPKQSIEEFIKGEAVNK